MLEDPNVTPPEDMWTKTVSPQNAPDKPLDLTIEFSNGLPVKVTTPDQTATDSVELFGLLNAIGKEHGVGRIVSFLPCFVSTHLTKELGHCREPVNTTLRTCWDEETDFALA